MVDLEKIYDRWLRRVGNGTSAAEIAALVSLADPTGLSAAGVALGLTSLLVVVAVRCRRCGGRSGCWSQESANSAHGLRVDEKEVLWKILSIISVCLIQKPIYRHS
ncbi:MAG: hypothetical protein R2941_12070 [Desulfobacterales bacterium]